MPARSFLRPLALLAAAIVFVVSAQGETPHPLKNSGGTIPVLMLADIHFDPFRDPGKVDKLRAAPVTEWEAILKAPPTATQGADFARLQNTCKARGVDSDWNLFHNSLKAEQQRIAHPAFIMLAGDLMVHAFDCRFHSTVGPSDAAAYSAFAEKIIAFVTLELRQTFPGVRLYIALGNNDSGCLDYHEDSYSSFLSNDGLVLADAAGEKRQRVRMARGFSAYGDYSVVLPAPMHRTRLIVLQDIFESSHFGSCKGAADGKQAEAQISWLRGELTRARDKGEQVWLMAHIPPGVDTYATVTQRHDVCGGAAPVSFLSSNALGETIDSFAGIIRLALFAHTHMDEMRLFRGAAGELTPGKMVPSISPVNGNHPAFTVADVDPLRATVRDYSVTYSTDMSGGAWAEEYRFSKAYGEKDFSGPSMAHLADELQSGKGTASSTYMHMFSAGDPGVRALALGLVWPGYACSIAHDDVAAYRQCACSGVVQPAVKP